MVMAEVRMDDLPSNSQKSRQQEAPAKPDIPVFQGETRQAKRKTGGFWRWFKKMFLSDRTPKEIAMEVVEQRIVPGLQDNFRNSAMAMLDGFIYKGGSAPGGSSNSVNYNKIYNGQTSRAMPAQTSANDSKKEEINKGFGNPCFKTQQAAHEFLATMKSYDYPTLSVHTLYMMQSKHIDYTWDAYGWNREEILALGASCVKHISDPDWPWMIQLPEAHVIA